MQEPGRTVGAHLSPSSIWVLCFQLCAERVGKLQGFPFRTVTALNLVWGDIMQNEDTHWPSMLRSVLIYVWDRETWCQKWRHAFVHAVLQKILKINQRYSSVAILMKPIISKNYNINVKFLSIWCYLTTVSLIGLEYILFCPMSQFKSVSSLQQPLSLIRCVMVWTRWSFKQTMIGERNLYPAHIVG